MVTSYYETTLDPMTRALMSMLRERRHDPIERAAIENMTPREIGRALQHEFRFEPIRIPKGTAPKPCRWCKTPVYWVPSRAMKGRLESVSIAGQPGECRAPTETEPGEGFSHLADCPQSVYRNL